MMYEEFEKKTGFKINPDYYKGVVEFVYCHAPTSIVGHDATSFCKWAREVSLTGIHEMYEVLHELSYVQSELKKAKAELEPARRKAELYEKLFTVEEIKTRLAEVLTVDDMLDAYGRCEE